MQTERTDEGQPTRWHLYANDLPKGVTIDANGEVVDHKDCFTDTRSGPEAMRRAKLFLDSQEKARRRFYQRDDDSFVISVFDLAK